jgi:hypothetical protein
LIPYPGGKIVYPFSELVSDVYTFGLSGPVVPGNTFSPVWKFKPLAL